MFKSSELGEFLYLMGTILLTYFLIGVAICIIVFLAAYVIETFEKEDVFWFLRKKQFHTKIANSVYQNLAGIFDLLLDSTRKDWSYDEVEKEIMFRLSDCYTIRYGPPKNNYDLKYITICYKRVQVFHLVMQSSRWSDVVGKLSHDSKEQLPELLMEETLSHLLSINEQLFKEREEKREKEATIKEQERKLLAKEKKEEEAKKASELKRFLYELESFDRAEGHDFVLTATEKSNNMIYEFSYKNTVYFEAFHNKKTGKITTKFLNGNEQEAIFFRLAENELMKFVYTMFSNQEGEPREELVKTIEQNVQRVLEKVERLSMEEKWLDIESKHQLTHTIPHDVKDLLNLYNEMEDKTKVKAKFMDSIHQIEEQLHAIKEKIEQRKELKFEQKAVIIEKRIASKK